MTAPLILSGDRYTFQLLRDAVAGGRVSVPTNSPLYGELTDLLKTINEAETALIARVNYATGGQLYTTTNMSLVGVPVVEMTEVNGTFVASKRPRYIEMTRDDNLRETYRRIAEIVMIEQKRRAIRCMVEQAEAALGELDMDITQINELISDMSAALLELAASDQAAA